MSETPEPSTGPTNLAATPQPPLPGGAQPPSAKPNRLYQAAAWVAIVAGIVFIVAVIFFAGFGLGRHANIHHRIGHHRHHHAMVHPGHHPKGGAKSVMPGGPGGPGGTGGAGAGHGPGQPPRSVAPSLNPSNP